MGLYLAKRITRPVQMLSAAAREIGAGRLEHRIEHQADDEFGNMVESFNAMAADLSARQRSLERATVELEQRHHEVERRHRSVETILERIATGVVSIDAHGAIGRVNSAAARLLDLGPDVEGRPVAEVLGLTPGSTYVKADVEVDGNKYTITFKQPTPKSTVDFIVSTGGSTTVEVDIRRTIIPRKPGRIDLTMKVPPCLLDHWSSNVIVQPAQQRVNGLGEAFDIARNKETFLQPKDLPLDFDDVIIQVRNNLIHLSGDALNAKISTIPDPDNSGDWITLGKFLETAEMVYDFMTTVPAFINQQYIELRRAGFLAN
jgi:HAMP domain-containing protein